MEWLYVYLIIMLKELYVTRQEETAATEISKKYQSSKIMNIISNINWVANKSNDPT